MIFLRYESFGQYIKFYPVNSIILVINILMFVILSINGGSENYITLLEFGAIYPGSPYWTYVSSMFLHIGIAHLLFNCFAILVFAPPLERLLGSFPYLMLYLVSGIVGNIFSQLNYQLFHSGMGPIPISAGASGAIYGVFGAYLFLILFRKRSMDPASVKTMQILLVMGLIYSIIVPNVNLAAHLGGLVGGLLMFGALLSLRAKK